MPDAEMQRLRTLGESLRALRMERGLSLGDVAEGTGLSSSFLSLVENGRSDISTGRLFRLARLLGVGLGNLLDTYPPHVLIVSRADERRSISMPSDGLTIYPVVTDHDGTAMAPAVCEYGVGARIRELPMMEGVEHFVFVVRGSIEIVLETGGPLVLGPGDCVYVGSHPVSEITNVGDGRAITLWVSSPPAAGGPGRP